MYEGSGNDTAIFFYYYLFSQKKCSTRYILFLHFFVYASYLHVCTIFLRHIFLSISDSTTGNEAEFQTINELHEHEAEIHDADDQKPVVSSFFLHFAIPGARQNQMSCPII